jgi:hypothetical protein
MLLCCICVFYRLVRCICVFKKIIVRCCICVFYSLLCCSCDFYILESIDLDQEYNAFTWLVNARWPTIVVATNLVWLTFAEHL